MFTHDIRFNAMAEDWQRQGIEFAGLAFGRYQGAYIGQYVSDLELLAKVYDPKDMENRIEYLPY